MTFIYDYPRPMVTVDTVVFARRADALEVLLIERGHDPFAGAWALPGGFLEMDEELIDAAARELLEETGVKVPWLRDSCVMGTVGRDPRGRTISAVFYTLLPKRPQAKAGDDAARVKWYRLDQLPEMAFDHGPTLEKTIERLRVDAMTSPLVFHLLPEVFTAKQFTEACAVLPGLEQVNAQTLQNLVNRRLVERVGEDQHRVRWSQSPELSCLYSS